LTEHITSEPGFTICLLRDLPGHTFYSCLQDKSSRLLVLALSADIRSNNTIVPAGHFKLFGGVKNKLLVIHENTYAADILFINLHENHPLKNKIKKNTDEGEIPADCFFTLISLCRRLMGEDVNKAATPLNPSLEILIHQLFKPGSSPLLIDFTSAMRVYETIMWASDKTTPLQNPEDLTAHAHMKSYKFRNGCKILFNMTPQSILQVIKMKRAMESFTHNASPIDSVVQEAGASVKNNFQIAFKDYFGISPFRVRQFYRDS
jgi:AraC-like DNA-binding protein